GNAFALVIATCSLLVIVGCGGGNQPPAPIAPPPGQQDQSAILTKADVNKAIQAAAASVNVGVTVAVTDRQGNILAVYQKPNTPATSRGNYAAMVDTNELAVGLARTASFFSNDQAPLSSRTVRYISGIHFPPGIDNVPSADL